MFIVTVKYIVDLDIVDKYLIAHRQFLDTLYKQNLLLASGPQNPRTNGGIIISLHNSKIQLEKDLAKDPFYINKVATYDILEFSPVKHHQQIIDLLNTK